MPDVAVASLDPRWQQLADQARAAHARGESEQALSVCDALLEHAPGCIEIRRLRQAAADASGEQQRVRDQAGAVLRGFRLLLRRRSPLELAQRAQAVLTSAPDSRLGWAALAKAARLLDWNETAVFAWERLHELQPAKAEVLLGLAQAYFVAEQWDKGREMLALFRERRPEDPRAPLLLREADAEQSLRDGKWEQGGNLSDKLRPPTSSPPPPPPPPAEPS